MFVASDLLGESVSHKVLLDFRLLYFRFHETHHDVCLLVLTRSHYAEGTPQHRNKITCKTSSLEQVLISVRLKCEVGDMGLKKAAGFMAFFANTEKM